MSSCHWTTVHSAGASSAASASAGTLSKHPVGNDLAAAVMGALYGRSHTASTTIVHDSGCCARRFRWWSSSTVVGGIALPTLPAVEYHVIKDACVCSVIA